MFHEKGTLHPLYCDGEVPYLFETWLTSLNLPPVSYMWYLLLQNLYTKQQGMEPLVKPSLNRWMHYMNLPTSLHVMKIVSDCEYCRAIRFPGEGESFCCRKGKVNVYIHSIPDELV